VATLRFDGLLVFCQDVPRSTRFYTEVLGLTRDPADQADVTVHLPTKGDEHGGWLLLHPASGPIQPHPIGTFALADASEVDALITRVRDAGHTVTEEPHDEPWGVRQAGIADPDGYGLTITAPLPAS